MDVNATRTRRSSQHVSCVLCRPRRLCFPRLPSSSSSAAAAAKASPARALPFRQRPANCCFPGRRQPPISLAQTLKTHTRQDDDQDEYNRLRVQPSLDCLPTSGEETPTIHILFTLIISRLCATRVQASWFVVTNSRLPRLPSPF